MNELILMLCEPAETNQAVAALFRRLPNRELPGKVEFRRLLDAARWTAHDVETLFGVVLPLLRDTRRDDEAPGVVLQQVLGWMAAKEWDVTAVVRDSARLLATEPPSGLRDAALDYMRRAGHRNADYQKHVEQECSEVNYATRSAASDCIGGDPAPGDWQSWEEDGWGGFERDWPIADLCFELSLDGHINHLLRKPRSALVPARHRVQYFLLHRLWRAQATSFERVKALGELVRVTSSNSELAELQDRAVLVFRNHWRLLPMEELTKMAAEAFAGVCALQATFQQPRSADLFDGLDPDHLRQIWGGSHSDLEAIESKIGNNTARYLR